MKRLAFLFLALLLLMAMVACSSQSATNPIISLPGTTPSETPTAPNTTAAPNDPTQPPVVLVTVTLDPMDDACEVLTVQVNADASYGQLPEPVRSGYVFLGWFTEREGGVLVDADTLVETEAEHTLYAHWALQTQFTATFDPNGGRISPYHSQLTVTVDQDYGTLPEPIREGYIFLGWYTEPEAGTQVKSTTKFTGREDLVLYARWKYDAFAHWTHILQSRVAQIPQCRREVVYLERTVGTKTYLTSDFLDAAGAINPAADLTDYKVTDEWIRSVNPYIIIKLTKDIKMGLVEKIGVLRRFPDQEIYIFPRAVVTGGEKSQLYYRLQLAKILYPEYFEDVDLTIVASELEIKPKIYY